MNTLLGSLFSGFSFFAVFLAYLAGIGIVMGAVNRFLPGKDEQ